MVPKYPILSYGLIICFSVSVQVSQFSPGLPVGHSSIMSEARIITLLFRGYTLLINLFAVLLHRYIRE